MSILDARGLREQLKARKIGSLYYFYGSDVMQVEQCTRQLLKTVTGGETDSVTKLDGAALDVSLLADEAEMCPMFADYNCIWIHDLNMDTQREDVRKAVMQVLEQVAPQTVLLFDVTGFDIYGGKTGKNKKPSAKNKKLIDYIAKHGTVCCLEPKSVSQTVSDIMAAVRKRGCTIERPAAQELAAQCRCQSLLLAQELGKLCAYVDSGEITEQLVREMVTPQLETTVYMLTNAVLRHKSADAMHAVNELLSLRTEMPYLMAAVSGSLIDVQRACAARQEGRTVQDVQHDFSYSFSFVVENAFRSSMGETMEHITACLQLLCDAEKRLHSGAVDERVLFERTIVEMLRR
ncbi:MAG: DNA polymerase III subunit delta [Oscillospiraceae bacterium]|nr:DNA polymerase III subunit delta [Oscillospiraceae bacterium]